MMERTQWMAGPHELIFEPPDIFHCRVLAPVELEHTKEVMRVLEEEVLPKVGYPYFLAHLIAPESGRVTPELKKYIPTLTPLWKGAALIGGTPLSRLLTGIVFRTLRLIAGTPPPPTVMVKTVEEAYAFVERMRAAERQAKAAGS